MITYLLYACSPSNEGIAYLYQFLTMEEAEEKRAEILHIDPYSICKITRITEKNQDRAIEQECTRMFRQNNAPQGVIF